MLLEEEEIKCLICLPDLWSLLTSSDSFVLRIGGESGNINK